MIRIFPTLLLLALTVLGTSCISHELKPVMPACKAQVSRVMVRLDPEVDGAKRKVLEKYEVPQQMSDALAQSFTNGTGHVLQVTITQFRVGKYGPSRMHVSADVVDSNGSRVDHIEADSTTLRSGNNEYKSIVLAQDIVNRIVEAVGPK